MFEEIAGPAPVDEMSREEESSWILNQLATNTYLFLCKNKAQEGSEGVDPLKKINKDDIVRFLELHHLEKYDVSNDSRISHFSFHSLDFTVYNLLLFSCPDSIYCYVSKGEVS